MSYKVKVPNLGDIDEVEVIEICVLPGEAVAVEDTLIVIESDKASMDVPAGLAGIVESIGVEVGDMVGEGVLIATINSNEEPNVEPIEADQNSRGSEPLVRAQAASSAVDTSDQTVEKTIDVLVPDISEAGAAVVVAVAIDSNQSVQTDDLLVVLESDKASMEISAEQSGEVLEVSVAKGDGVETGSLIARLRVKDGMAGAQNTTATLVEREGKTAGPSADAKPFDRPVQPATVSADEARGKVYAGPATRRLARELGVEISLVEGSGQRGRIVKDDVKTYVKAHMLGSSSIGGGLPTVPVVDFERFGSVRLIPMTKIRLRGADNLHRSWVNLPHVTQHDEVDITDLEVFRKKLGATAAEKDIRLTPLAFIIKACVKALQEYPEFNASLDADGQQLVVKEYINIGMAVDTPEGLVVPVIKQADQKDVWALSNDIAVLAAKARDKKLKLDDQLGGTFTVSSLGALGGTGFTPIVNAPEVAILGVARLVTKPLWDGEQFQPRKVLPLSLSYDHRVINGADGGRFMVRLTELLGDIRHLAL